MGDAAYNDYRFEGAAFDGRTTDSLPFRGTAARLQNAPPPTKYIWRFITENI
jgi:hypothetical protein